MEISIQSYSTLLTKTSNIDFVRYTKGINWDYYSGEWCVIVSLDEMGEFMKLYCNYVLTM